MLTQQSYHDMSIRINNSTFTLDHEDHHSSSSFILSDKLNFIMQYTAVGKFQIADTSATIIGLVFVKMLTYPFLGGLVVNFAHTDSF